MPNTEMTKWLISQVQLNMNALEKGNNELKMNFSFSALFPDKNFDAEKEGHVRIDFIASTPEGKKFLSVICDSFYKFSSTDLSEQEKREMLENQGFPETYEKFRTFLKNFTESAQLRTILLPDYFQLR